MTAINKKIKVLDKITANQIAAGEVIEAPSSVVKELVENSIDALSTQISIKVEKGGTDLIIVHDNGIGMTKEDLQLAFESHATSKITSAQDLNFLNTLGFRGEALPSISSIAKVQVTTKTVADLLGWELTLVDGNITNLIEKGCNTGTLIKVEELFYNTPARKKYLKSPLTEMGNITDIVSKLALANPHISFTLTSNERLVLKTPGSDKLLDVITCLWGVEMGNNLIAVSESRQNVSVTGYIGRILYHRPNRKGQLFFVNNRYIKSQVIAQGLEEGYSTLLPINRFPFGIIKVVIAPEEIDVNIHPTKLEVKFIEPEQIKNIVKEIVSASIQHKINNTFKPAIKQTTPISTDNLNIQESQMAFVNFKQSHIDNNVTNPVSPVHKKDSVNSGINPNSHICRTPERISHGTTNHNYAKNFNETAVEQSIDSPPAELQLKPLGQLNRTYIICEGEDGLYLIDQHAAHERVIYNRLMANQAEKIPSQQLLFPASIELTPSESDIVIENILKLRDLGFILEHFGGTSYVLREVPQDLPQGEEVDCFYELLGLFQEEYKEHELKFRDKAITLLSCKKAIKAGECLTEAEIKYLLVELGKVANHLTCPHGRPTIISFSNDFIAKKFLRK